MHEKVGRALAFVTAFAWHSVVVAESCERKWAEYYAGKSWFEPWCDTEAYERRQKQADQYENSELYDDAAPSERSRAETAAAQITFVSPTYSVLESCNVPPGETCINIYGTFVHNGGNELNSYWLSDNSVKEVLLDCRIRVDVNGESKEMRGLYYARTATGGSVIYANLEPGAQVITQLFQGRQYYDALKSSQKIAKAYPQSDVSLVINASKESIGGIASVDCRPIFAF